MTSKFLLIHQLYSELHRVKPVWKELAVKEVYYCHTERCVEMSTMYSKLETSMADADSLHEANDSDLEQGPSDGEADVEDDETSAQR